jgi:hypothetical protein
VVEHLDAISADLTAALKGRHQQLNEQFQQLRTRARQAYTHWLETHPEATGQQQARMRRAVAHRLTQRYHRLLLATVAELNRTRQQHAVPPLLEGL